MIRLNRAPFESHTHSFRAATLAIDTRLYCNARVAARSVLAGLKPGLRFLVRLTYGRNPGRYNRPVIWRKLRSGIKPLSLTAKWVGNKMFETDVVTLVDRVTP